MNAIFVITIVLSVAVLGVLNGQDVTLALVSGATNAVYLAVKLLAIYSVWLGIFKILEQTMLVQKLAKLMRKPLGALFGNLGNAEGYVSLNVTANLLGVGGVASAYGIKAFNALDKQNNVFAMSMLFVISCTSLQILPLSVVSLLAESGAKTPSAIILPSIISTLFSTALGIVLVKIFIKNERV